MAIDAATGTLAVAIESPPRVLLYSLGNPRAMPRAVELPGVVTHLSVAGGSLLAPVASANQVVEINIVTGGTHMVPVSGGPTSATEFDGQLLVAVPGARGVAVLTGDRLARTITGAVSPDEVLAVATAAVLVDQSRSAVFDVDVAAGTIGAGQRAGDGATNAVADSYQRVLVVDTRAGELLAFSAGPVLMRQRYPVPGAPFGLAYDTRRGLAWVTVTALNQVVGFDMAGGEPVEKYRMPTVRQPNSVAVDPTSGRVIVASASGGGIQVIQP